MKVTQITTFICINSKRKHRCKAWQWRPHNTVLPGTNGFVLIEEKGSLLADVPLHASQVGDDHAHLWAIVAWEIVAWW